MTERRERDRDFRLFFAGWNGIRKLVRGFPPASRSNLYELITFMRSKSIVTQGNGRVTEHGMEVDELYV